MMKDRMMYQLPEIQILVFCEKEVRTDFIQGSTMPDISEQPGGDYGQLFPQGGSF